MNNLFTKGFLNTLISICAIINIGAFVLLLVDTADIAGEAAEWAGTVYAVGFFLGAAAALFLFSSIIHLALTSFKKYLTK